MSEIAVFHIEGGIGKHVAATAVVECYKKHNPSTAVVVVCAWPEVFLNNPFVHRVFRLNSTPYFYQDYIHGKDVTVFAQEPYKTSSHITKKKHLLDSWCDMIGVERTNEMPRIFFNFREQEIANKSFENPTNKPVLIFQPFGGPGATHQSTPYSWMRDIHPDVAQRLVNVLSEKYFVVHICYEFHPVLQNCHRIDKPMPKKVLFSMLQQSSARLLIDSSLQHAAAALNLPSTVVWVATQPEIFGYTIHHNVKPLTNPQFLKGNVDSYLYDYNFTGEIHECPFYSHSEIFDIDQILKSL
jgi:ADP-heptose:LPS heptosyltransferase